jgi:hypothetical protein
MKIQSVRIKPNDFPEDQKELAETLGGLLNPFVDKLVSAFNKNFTVEDNLPFEFKTLDIQVDVNGIPVGSVVLSTGLNNLKGYLCVNVQNINNLPLPTTAVSLITQTSGFTVNVSKITGLPSGGVYRLILLGIS